MLKSFDLQGECRRLFICFTESETILMFHITLEQTSVGCPSIQWLWEKSKCYRGSVHRLMYAVESRLRFALKHLRIFDGL